VNVINAIIGYESMFVVETLELTTLLAINKDDIDLVSKKNLQLHDEIKEMEAKYKFTGLKYDYTVFFPPRSESKSNTP